MNTRTERWNTELLLRYLCATLVTWIAAAGAQLVVRSDFCVVIGLVALLGAPVSLLLRLNGMHVFGISLSRPLWNAFTVIVFFVSAGLWTLSSMSDLLSLVLRGGASQSYWLRFGAESSLALLMQVFLLFAAFRSFALISDRDATLATVPSFSVLLLLIPVHKGIEVVLYFLLWTLAATTLFALDHRAELREGANGRVPSPLPEQDGRMAVRGFVTVLSAALVAAFSLSALVSSRSADDRNATESAITSLVGRLAQFAMGSSDSSTGSAIERQIDFSSGPSLPSRALLWQVRVSTMNDRIVHPSYFRLFTLSRFNGSSWTQSAGMQKRIILAPFTFNEWPLPSSRPVRDRLRHDDENRGDLNNRGVDGNARRPRSPATIAPLTERRLRLRQSGFAIQKAWPLLSRHFGNPTELVRVRIASSATNIGFVPLMPGPRALSLPNTRLDELRVGSDGSAEMGFVAQDQRLQSLCDVPRLPEYGFAASVPLKKVVARTDSPDLAPSERARYLEAPKLSQRTLRFATNALGRPSDDENNYARAQRLALAIQSGATYTLRPPTPSVGQEATDFFLFDGNRRGYCTHFASALAVLCRSQGIPARLVSGFAVQDHSSDFTMLREANAHAWTEVWIDNWGWALVDATPSADRGDNAPNVFAYWADWFGFAFNQLEMWGRSRLWLVVFLVGTLCAGVFAFRRRARLAAWWARRRGRVASDEWTRREIIAAYELAAPRLEKLFRPRASFETPDEWLAAAKQSALDAPRARLFARHEFELLTNHYVRALYAPHAPETSVVDDARALARQIRHKNKNIPKTT